MIHDLDRSLERLLRDRVPLRDEHVCFDAPDEAFRARLNRTALTIDLFLYDLRENHELRTPDWTVERLDDGRAVRRPPPARIDLCYMVTAWSPADPPDVLAEHALLGQILRTLLRHPVLPADVLQGSLAGQEPPLPTLVAQPDGPRNLGEFWSSLRQPPRPCINLVVTLGIDPSAPAEETPRLVPVTSRELVIGQVDGAAYRLAVRPSLSVALAAGSAVRRLAVSPGPAATLQQSVFARRDVLRIAQQQLLPSHEWVLIDDATALEFVRLGAVPGSGTQVVEVTPPLQFAHDPVAGAIPLRRVTVPEQDVAATTLADEAPAGSASLRVATTERLTAGEALLISDGERTEVVEVTAVPTASGPVTISVRPPLRFRHADGRNLYRRLLERDPTKPPVATLAGPAAQPGNTIVLDRSLPAGDLLMIGVGPDVEFCRLTASAVSGASVGVTPSLRNDHLAGTPVRRLTPAEMIGRLALAAPLGSMEVVLSSELGLPRTEPVSSGEVLLLGEANAGRAVQIVALQPATGTAVAAETLFTIGGRVTHSPAGSPVVGASVTLVQSGLTAITNEDGHFTFANLLPGGYTLHVAATGYQDAERSIEVPARTDDEYRVTLNP